MEGHATNDILVEQIGLDEEKETHSWVGREDCIWEDAGEEVWMWAKAVEQNSQITNKSIDEPKWINQKETKLNTYIKIKFSKINCLSHSNKAEETKKWEEGSWKKKNNKMEI